MTSSVSVQGVTCKAGVTLTRPLTPEAVTACVEQGFQRAAELGNKAKSLGELYTAFAYVHQQCFYRATRTSSLQIPFADQPRILTSAIKAAATLTSLAHMIRSHADYRGTPDFSNAPNVTEKGEAPESTDDYFATYTQSNLHPTLFNFFNVVAGKLCEDQDQYKPLLAAVRGLLNAPASHAEPMPMVA